MHSLFFCRRADIKLFSHILGSAMDQKKIIEKSIDAHWKTVVKFRFFIVTTMVPKLFIKGGCTMRRSLTVAMAVLCVFAASVWSQNTSAGAGAGAGGIGIGFDEGAFARLYIINNVAAYIGFGYYVIGADTVTDQPLNRATWKVGGEYVFKDFGKLRVNAFAECKEELNQGQTAPVNGATIRFNEWNTIIRIGIRPEWFLLDNLSIDYKIGMQYTHYGTSFKLNADGSGVESRKNDHDEFGFYCGRSPFLENHSLLLNIGVTIYMGKLSFWPFAKKNETSKN
jgi:hypothetical protein